MKKNLHTATRFWDDVGRRTGKKLDSYERNRYKAGAWYGNDTLWRTILDINYAVMYSDKQGKIQRNCQRKILSFGDMIVCGENNGPLSPTYKRVGGILYSDNSVIFDSIVVALMGFDWKKFPVLVHATEDMEKFSFSRGNNGSDEILLSNDKRFVKPIKNLDYSFGFKPASGWSAVL